MGGMRSGHCSQEHSLDGVAIIKLKTITCEEKVTHKNKSSLVLWNMFPANWVTLNNVPTELGKSIEYHITELWYFTFPK